jgi:hypothetical protein
MGRYRIESEGGFREIHAAGRVEWALLQLVVSGEKGVTPIDRPAPRWSDYVRKLRLLGVDIETIREPHGGAFRGHHGRYVLRSRVRPMEARDAA